MIAEDTLETIRVALGADLALLLAASASVGRLRVMDRAGGPAAQVPDEILAPAGSSLARVLAGTLPGRLPRLALAGDGTAGRSRRLGPAMVVPALHPVLGETIVVVARKEPRRPFDDGDLARVRGLLSAARTGAPPRGALHPRVRPLRTTAKVPGGTRLAVVAPPAAGVEAVAGGVALRAAFDGAPAGMSLVDGALCFRWVNLALCAMLGRERHRLLGLGVADVVDPAHADRALALFARLRGGEGAVRDRVAFARPDGRRVWADVGGSLFTGAPDPPLYLLQQFDVTAELERAEDMAHRAMHDELTGLANRALLRERLQAVLARRGGRRAVAFYLDIDSFKDINDRYGHTTGDAVLREVADRLAGVTRLGDTVARIGGDEFVVAGEVTGAVEASHLAERIGVALRPPVSAGGNRLAVTVSIGVALSVPQDRPEDLVDRADQALLGAKHRTGVPGSAAEALRRH